MIVRYYIILCYPLLRGCNALILTTLLLPTMPLMQILLAGLCVGTLASAQTAQTPAIYSLPYELTYLLPQGFVGDPSLTFFGGTTTHNATVNAMLSQANQATFVSYDAEFLTIIGSNPAVKLIEYRPGTLFAFEAGVWVPTTNEVWFSSALSTYPS